MRRFVAVLIASSAIVVSGCYHAVVDTGRAPTGAPNVTPWALAAAEVGATVRVLPFDPEIGRAHV